MSELLTYLNGRFLPASQAVLSLDDLGFVWGATVTDRLRTFNQKPFRLDDHLRRFRNSCDAACVPQPRGDTELAQAIQELVAHNARLLAPGAELSIVLFATPGTAGQPTLGIQAFPLDFARYRRTVLEGAILEPVARSIPAELLDPAIKHRSRLPWWIAQQSLRRERVDSNIEPLLTTGQPHSYVRETPTANILVEIDGTLCSPPRREILNGISLQVVSELCGSLGIPFVEREIPLLEVVSNAGECLLSNTSYCLAPVAMIGPPRKPVGGMQLKRLIQAWSELVGVDIRLQFSG